MSLLLILDDNLRRVSQIFLIFTTFISFLFIANESYFSGILLISIEVFFYKAFNLLTINLKTVKKKKKSINKSQLFSIIAMSLIGGAFFLVLYNKNIEYQQSEIALQDFEGYAHSLIILIILSSLFSFSSKGRP